MRRPNPHAFCIWPQFNCFGLGERREGVVCVGGSGVGVKGGGGGGGNFEMLEMLAQPAHSVTYKTWSDPFSNATASTWRETHMDLVFANHKPPFSC